MSFHRVEGHFLFHRDSVGICLETKPVQDKKDYKKDGTIFSRPSVRAIVIKGDKIAVVHSKKYNYYKIPGGGIEIDESHVEALIREAREEAGLIIRKETIKEYGYVHRIQKNTIGDVDIFIQDNYYYLCEAEDYLVDQELDDYEDEEDFSFSFEHYQKVIDCNRNIFHGPKDKNMIEREARIIELLKKEGYFSSK